MATVILSAAGAAIGGSLGTGAILGVTGAMAGRFVGAMIGNTIDQRLLGSGCAPVETGKIDRFRLMGASAGSPVGQVYGRMRVGGQVIWATQFVEHTTTTGGGGGKGGGAPAQAEVTEYTYTVSLAVAVCEGTITRIGRIWADGQEVATTDLNMRVYPGNYSQQPDPKIAAVQGAAHAPAFRGTAYVVFEDLPLSPYGNRVPQFSFEVLRPTQITDDNVDSVPADLADAVQAVALMPGSGEYTLASRPVHYDFGQGRTKTANVHTGSGQADMPTAIAALGSELPRCGAASLIVSWFGDDLRCGECRLTPRVEQNQNDGVDMPWTVSGLTRQTAPQVPYIDGRPGYGGTPTDQSVIEGIRSLQNQGQKVLFYPFILMTQQAGNRLPNPWGG
ncbi:MAG: host specificity protein, partial [Pseudomonadota bacterium]